MFLNIIFLVVYATSTALSGVVLERLQTCGLSEFSCGDGTCIPLRSFCDGISDCVDGSDEESCSSGLSSSQRFKKQVGLSSCAFDEWQCKDGSCIGIEDRCNGAISCPDGSDETEETCWNNVCQESQFRCLYGGCVQSSAPCDGVIECADSSDELMSRCFNQTFDENDIDFDVSTKSSRFKRQVSSCRRNQFPCKDGTCISSYDKCDGVKQCPDGSDETFALCRKNKLRIYKKSMDKVYKIKQEKLWKEHSDLLTKTHYPKRCQSNWFRCMYGACVDGTAPCNTIQDCADNSDELLPRCRNENDEVRGTFKCDDGQTIPAYSHCDGVRDCVDGSDETLKACAAKTCSSYLFQCAYGACVDQGSDCDNKIDCADGSDESDDLCNRTTTISTPPPPPPPPPSGPCKLPSYPRHGSYIVSNMPNAVPGQSFNSVNLNITCNSPYRVDGESWRICTGGQWYPSDSIENSCALFCKLPQNQGTTYLCRLTGDESGSRKCKEYEPVQTELLLKCNDNYYDDDNSVEPIICLGHHWSKQIKCQQECGRVVSHAIGLVYGGRDAVLGEVTWHAAIYSKGWIPFRQICGGTLINTRTVISAAHCFYEKGIRKPPSHYAVAFGKIHRPWNVTEELSQAQYSDLNDIVIPPEYQHSDGNYQADIAIMLLNTTIRYTKTVMPICLDFNLNNERSQLFEGNKAKVAGWGLTGPVEKESQILKVVELPFVPVDKCQANAPVTFRQVLSYDKICAGYINGTAALCKGDSGGGLVFPSTEKRNIIRFYLRGIVSAAPTASEAVTCNVNWYTTFTAVSKHEILIKDTIEKSNRLPIRI